jgi:ketosteroid isomerase-like protein
VTPNDTSDDRDAVAALDDAFQAAVKSRDAETIDRILADDFILVNGRGDVCGKRDLLPIDVEQSIVYERQESTLRAVRQWGDTAIVTARLRAKGVKAGQPFDHGIWFSDTYVRADDRWRMVLGQASLPIPNGPDTTD